MPTPIFKLYLVDKWVSPGNPLIVIPTPMDNCA